MEKFGVPIEIFLKIIKLLPIKQLMICKAVNKTWHHIIASEFRFKKLVLSTTSHFNRRWYLTYEFVCPSDLIKINNFNRLNLDQANFLMLKRLYLYWEKENKRFISEFSIGNLVNPCKQLEQLELFGLQSKVQNHCIALESLKTLHISQCNLNELLVKCPNLINLKMNNDDYYGFKIKFEYPKTVKSLEISRLRSDWVKEFSNLEKLSLHWIYGTRAHFLTGN